MPASVLLFWNYSHKISHLLFSKLFWHNRLKPTSEIEFESNFSRISQHLRSTEYSTFLTYWQRFWELDPLRLNVRLISAVYHNNLMAIYLYDHWKILRIRPSETKFQNDFNKFVYTFLIAGKFWELAEFESHFSSNHSIFYTGTL